MEWHTQNRVMLDAPITPVKGENRTMRPDPCGIFLNKSACPEGAGEARMEVGFGCLTVDTDLAIGNMAAPRGEPPVTLAHAWREGAHK